MLHGLPLTPQPGNAAAPPGGGYIVSGAPANRYWINGTPLAVNANGYVAGIQNSTTPANPVVNNGTGAPYFSYTDPASVPVSTIWVPQPATGAVTNYAPVQITMPQTSMRFTGNDGLFFNNQLQIAGGAYPVNSQFSYNYTTASYMPFWS